MEPQYQPSMANYAKYGLSRERNVREISANDEPTEQAPELSSNLNSRTTYSKNLCTSCRHIIADILEDDFPVQRWTRLSSKYNAIHYYHENKDNTIPFLSDSASTGCELCTAIVEKLAPQCVSDEMTALTYNIYVKTPDREKHRFYICLGDCARYTNHMSEWYKEMPTELRLLTQSAKCTDQNRQPSEVERVNFRLNKRDSSLTELADRNLGSAETFEIARAWLQNCLTKHKLCHPLVARLPKRLLKLHVQDSADAVKLYLSSPQEEGVYATLSYTWGDKIYERLKTLNHTPSRPDCTEDNHCRGIALERFPQTLQDAIHIARVLGFEYLWIDSLCIIQDNVDDWATQSAEMTRIYSGARLNISATDSKNSQFGILLPTAHSTGFVCRTTMLSVRSDRLSGSDTPILEAAGVRDVFIDSPSKVLDLESGYLATRAWVFQERLVSPATLHYTEHGIVWECVEETRNACGQGKSPQEWKRQWWALKPSLERLNLDDGQNFNDTLKKEALKRWNQWVAAYSERELYAFCDKLPAVAGIAKSLALRFGLSYKAGLWQEAILSGLAWKRCKRRTTLKRFEYDRAPSWSWASVQGKLVYIQAELKDSSKGPKLVILEPVRVTEEIPGAFGRVISAEMHVRGRMQKIVVDKDFQPIPGRQEYQEFGIRSGFKYVNNVVVTYDEPVKANPCCWCLRLGSWDHGGRESHVFLLLEQVSRRCFRRIGLAETDAHLDASDAEHSGVMTDDQEHNIVLV